MELRGGGSSFCLPLYRSSVSLRLFHGLYSAFRREESPTFNILYFIAGCWATRMRCWNEHHRREEYRRDQEETSVHCQRTPAVRRRSSFEIHADANRSLCSVTCSILVFRTFFYERIIPHGIRHLLAYNFRFVSNLNMLSSWVIFKHISKDLSKFWKLLMLQTCKIEG